MSSSSGGEPTRPPTPRTGRSLLFATALLACLGILAGTAHAHSGIQSYVYVSFTDSEVDGRVEYPQADLGEILGIDFPSEPEAAAEVALANAHAIREYTAEHLAMSDADGEWELSFTDDPTILPAAGGYVLVPFTVERTFSSAPRSFEVEYDGVIHADPERDALFIVENDWGTARFANEGDHLLGFSVGATTQNIELEDVGTLESIGAARGLGTDVVRDGVDHLVFVVALLLPAAFAPALGGRGGPSPTTVGATRRALALLGIFVATSSLSLWIAGLASIDWSTRTVGSLVAASLLVMAVYALWRFTTRERLLVGVLGAVQGIGYAQAFVDIRLDRVGTPLALLAFHLGTIVAIVTITLLVFPVLLLLRRTPFTRVVGAVLGGALCVYGAAWLVERLSGSDLPVERIATPLSIWPRNLWFVALAWLLAGALSVWATRRDSLRPDRVDGTDSNDDHSAVMS